MPNALDARTAAVGFLASFLVCVLTLLTRQWHERFTIDSHVGPQKVHIKPTPRVGGVGLLVGFWLATGLATPPVRSLLTVIGLAAIPALLAGLAEDLSKNIPWRPRLLATAVSGVAFCLASGYSVTRLDFPLVDYLFEIPGFPIAFAAFALCGLANAINVIDGVNGLAPGTVLLQLGTLTIVAQHASDAVLVSLGIALAGVVAGFFVVNFPLGYVFAGDGGAYFLGLLMACFAILLPERNPSVSPWVSFATLAYPVVEMSVSVYRKGRRQSTSPAQPDKLHLHLLVFRELAKKYGDQRFANPGVSVIVWTGLVPSLAMIAFLPHTRTVCLLILALQYLLYASLYRRLLPLVRLLPWHRPRRRSA